MKLEISPNNSFLTKKNFIRVGVILNIKYHTQLIFMEFMN